jgi:hypothetical protein
MNDDFTELENELKNLRPSPPSSGLVARVEQELARPDEQKIVHLNRFRTWAAMGFGLAAAAVFLLFLRINLERRQAETDRVARMMTPAPELRSTSVNEFVPADTTQVVYNTRDEGLHFSSDTAQPLRRLRYQTYRTLQWRNPTTGASLRVSYPSEEVVFIPVSGQ